MTMYDMRRAVWVETKYKYVYYNKTEWY